MTTQPLLVNFKNFNTLFVDHHIAQYKKAYSKYLNVIEFRNILEIERKVESAKGAIVITNSKFLDLINTDDIISSRNYQSCYFLEYKEEIASDEAVFDQLSKLPAKNPELCFDGFVNSHCFFVHKDSCSDFLIEDIKFAQISYFNNDVFVAESYKKALFLDRDGVVNIDTGYVHEVSKFEFVPGILDILKLASDHKYLKLIVTNQAGVAKGKYDYLAVEKFNDHLKKQLALHGEAVDGIEVCPYHEEGSVLEYKKFSFLRKPYSGMIHKHLKNFPIFLKHSKMIGDRKSDILDEFLITYYIIRSRYELDGIDHVYDDLFSLKTSINFS